ncbi:MAG: hypothetical protein H7Y27_15740 [Gemmatimonadaceae bacterium]|nr:hypothetical protein [Chitinophagaceae bacterium]
MSKKVLAIYYTQTGQLGEIIDNFMAPFREAGMAVEKVVIHPAKEFGFPWSSESFFDAMPESVLGKPAPLAPFQLNETSYDLVILGYQPWFLNPSIPSSSLLQDSGFRKIIANTPVVTVIGARNMWLNAQEKIKKTLREAGAKLVGNVALVDRNGNIISAFTILYWMLNGKKDRKWGIFPLPGVADKDIQHASVFGKITADHLAAGTLDSLQTALIASKAVEVKSDLMFIEGRAPKLFSIWANIINKKKNRKGWLVGFKYYLLIALFIIAPIILAVNNILFKPFLTRSINRKKQYYLELN